MAEFSAEIKELGDRIVALTLGKAVELGNYMEQVHGIKAAAGAVAAAPGAATPGPAPVVQEVQTEFAVQLEGLADPGKKISVIKVVREITSCGLAEGKTMVESAPKVLKEGLSKADAETLKKKLEDAGAKVSLK
jgi:large subunit ribosomal protein L7/L12